MPLTTTCFTHLGAVFENTSQSMDGASAREVAILWVGARLMRYVRNIRFKHMPEHQLAYLIL